MFAASRPRGLAVLRGGDGLMPGPHPLVIGDRLAVTEHLHLIQIRGDFDAPTDHPRVHRVVIGIQPDVVIPG
jgi:hypothetical protein